jgi:acetyl-CoA synthetase
MKEKKIMSEKPEKTDVSEAQIASHWKEEGYYPPSAKFIAQANMTDEGIYERFALENVPDCFKEYADLLDWYKYWDEILDTSDAPCYKWFKGGLINASHNCVDRHLAQNRNKTAIHFVPELEEEKVDHVTYQELWVRVNEFAALLQDFCGLKAGDRVTLHMPMSAELPITIWPSAASASSTPRSSVDSRASPAPTASSTRAARS